MLDDFSLPVGAYSLDIPFTHLHSFLRELGIRLWFVPAHLPKDPCQVMVSVQDCSMGCCRDPWVVLEEEALREAQARESPKFYVLNREDLVAYTDAPLF